MVNEMDKEAILVAIQGYSQANEIIEAERMQRLTQMTENESRAIFNELVSRWKNQSDKTDIENLEQWRLETALTVREAFLQMSHARGYL